MTIVRGDVRYQLLLLLALRPDMVSIEIRGHVIGAVSVLTCVFRLLREDDTSHSHPELNHLVSFV